MYTFDKFSNYQRKTKIMLRRYGLSLMKLKFSQTIP